MDRILIVEDEESILMALTDDLTLEGYDVASARDGLQGLALAQKDPFDLILLDIMLPGLDGFEVCKRLRTVGDDTPILMLTAKSQEIDKVLGLELGADDYVTKPFSPRELLARVKALLRRAKGAPGALDGAQFGAVEIDFAKCEAVKAGQPVDMTILEFSLLKCLVRHEGQVVSRKQILDEVWGEDVYVLPKTVDTHIGHLRKKLEDDPANPRHILGVRGMGYRFTA
jgi:two-component system alkaline phosphatase synthesis response regulator PhoP